MKPVPVPPDGYKLAPPDVWPYREYGLWSDRDREYLRQAMKKEMENWPRDEKGRWLSMDDWSSKERERWRNERRTVDELLKTQGGLP